MITFSLKSSEQTEQLGRVLGENIASPCIIFLLGDLGAGKTTLSRGFIQAVGFAGAVKSPTYTLVEPYVEQEKAVYHFDLYRIADPEELEYMGIEEFFTDTSVCLVEWPERGEGWLPNPDLIIELCYNQSERTVKIKIENERFFYLKKHLAMVEKSFTNLKE